MMLRKRANKRWWWIFLFWLYGCQTLEVEEILERSRKIQPAWVNMYEKGVWTGEKHSYIVVAFHEEGELKQSGLKSWLQQQRRLWAKDRKVGVETDSVKVADLYYEQSRKETEHGVSTVNTVYVLLQLHV